MNNKYKYLLKDLLLFALSTFIPKAISFFFVPLYTNYLSTTEYGTMDIIGTTISLCIPFLTLDISDAVLRFTIENKTDKKPFQIAFKIVIRGIVLILCLTIINAIIGILTVHPVYQIFFVVNYALTALYGINVAYLRATDNIKLLSIISIVNTTVIVLLNVFTLAVLKMGIYGYLFSNIFTSLLVNCIIFYKIKLFSLLKKSEKTDKILYRQMVSYSKPLIASGVAWWINSASDRYFVTYICGIKSNGIYSVAYKIPTILQIFQNIFSQAWLLSVYREYNKPEGKEFVSKIYDFYNSAMCILCAFLIFLDIPMSSFLYAKDFFEAWKYVPALLISVVFIANAGFFESLITLFKKSRIVATTTIIGALVNIFLNVLLIYFWGIQGAAIATTAGYFVMCLLRIIAAYKIFPFYVNWFKHGFMIALLVVEALILVLLENYFICALIIVIMIIIDFKTIVKIIYQIKTKVNMCKRKE